MKVVMRVSISGTRDGEDWPRAGQVADLPNDEAVHLLNAGLARPCDDEPVERADASEAKVERATARTATRKPRKS